MKHSKPMVLVSLAVASACALAGLVVLQRMGKHTPAQPPAQVKPMAGAPSRHKAVPLPPAPAAAEPSLVEPKVVPAEAATPSSTQTNVSGLTSTPKVTSAKPASPPPAPGGDSSIQDPLAREALGLVGLDPRAEAYWMEAINDSRLSAHERQDLIEDLNEDGLSDPKHPSPEDLPVILNRLALIEELAPNAMDQVNSDAFNEAYKDLVNLADLALGGGKPVN